MLLEELKLHPLTGTGKPELLKHQYKGCFSRRITQRHRLIYSIEEETITVLILSAYGHYGDK
ncbi:MAG: Txe/YoeB family addiction module toxin [Tannerellaceae bacterium]|nr:Txe/YoeB family addiction module toxin [Tannerellaceae bacterium]